MKKKLIYIYYIYEILCFKLIIIIENKTELAKKKIKLFIANKKL
jgi:hypothetical protein